MIGLKQIAREFIAALSVLALVFLSFSHQPVPTNEPVFVDAYQVSILSFCGDAPGDSNHAHGPCHACRASVALLPPPPCAAEPAYNRFITTVGLTANDRKPVKRATKPYSPRAPPFSA